MSTDTPTPKKDAAKIAAELCGDSSVEPDVLRERVAQLERELAEANKACQQAGVDALMMRDDLLKRLADHERWLREMCEDYRLAADDHAVSRRLAINGLIHDIRNELAALRRDKERLDWLEASPYRHVEGDYWDTGNPYWRCQDRKNVNTIACIGPDIRAAIDAAIAQEGRT